MVGSVGGKPKVWSHLFLGLGWLALGVPLAVAGDDDQALNRWAIIASEELQEAGASDLLAAELSCLEGVQLVEREAIDLLLAELKLNASGLADPNKAVEFGRLLPAEVLVLVQTEPDIGPGTSRVRLIETRTGVRLLDRISEHSVWKMGATQLLVDFRHALGKLRTPEPQRRYIGMVGIRSEESGTALDTLARALTALLERDFSRLRGFVVLERERMQHLTAERDLTAIELRLLPSTVLIEGGLRRTGGPDRLAVTLKLTPLAGGKVKFAEVAGPASDIGQLRLALVKRIQSELDVPHDEAKLIDLREEAAAFAHESMRLMSHGRREEALRLVETALALDTSPHYFEMAYKLYHAAADKGHQGFYDELGRRRPLVDRLRWHIRAQQIDCTRLERYGAIRPLSGRLFLLHYVFGPLDDLPHGRRPVEGGKLAEVRRLASELRRVCTRKYDLLIEQFRRHHGTVLPVMLTRLRRAHFICETPEQFVKSIRSQVTMLDRELAAGDYDPTRAYHFGGYGGSPSIRHEYYAAIKKQVELATGAADPDGMPWRWPDWSGEQGPFPCHPDDARPLLSWLQEHGDPANRMIGYLGAARIEKGEVQLRAARQTLDILFNEIPADHPMDPPLDSGFFAGIAHAACRTLHDNDRLAEWFDPVLDRAEQTKDATALVLRSRAVREILFFGRSGRAPEWGRRIRALLEANQFDTADWTPARARGLRTLLEYRPVQVQAGRGRRPREHGGRVGSKPPTARSTPIGKDPPQLYEIRRVRLDHRARTAEGDEQRVVFWESGGVTRSGIRRWALREVARLPLADRPTLTCAAISPEAVFVGTKEHGFTMIAGQTVERIGESEGAPGEDVTAMAWLSGGLYVAYPGIIARFDPDTKEFAILASSQSVVWRHELDGSNLYRVKSMLADPARNAIWLSVDGRSTRARNGYWKHVAGTDRFEIVFETGLRDRLWWHDGSLVFPADYLPGFGLPDTPENRSRSRGQLMMLPPGEDQFVLPAKRLAGASDALQNPSSRFLWWFREVSEPLITAPSTVSEPQHAEGRESGENHQRSRLSTVLYADGLRAIIADRVSRGPDRNTGRDELLLFAIEPRQDE